MRIVLGVQPWPVFVVAGALIGLLTGTFGVGGSAIATPLMAVLGVPGLLAIASPLPATIPSALAALGPFVRGGDVRPKAAGWTLLGGVPAVVVGSLLSKEVGGPALLVISGVVLVIIGIRVCRPISETHRIAGFARRQNRVFLVVASAGVGLFTGLLANGGGFLLVPMYLLIFGLEMRESAGTSLLVISVLAIPTLVAHAALGNIDWKIAGAFALGAVPASLLSARYSQRVTGTALRQSFGVFLVTAGLAFTFYRLLGA
jgi:uncharacterized membrane protein YfcA